jgi:hypothetical protein
LERFWSKRGDIEWSDQLAIALVVSEIANGDISRRPWAILWETERVLSVLAHAVLNLIFFCVRAENVGVEQRPYIKGVAYLTLAAIYRSSASVVTRLFENVWDDSGPMKLPKSAREVVLEPVLNQLSSEIRDVCVDDCVRISTDPIELTERERDRYWQRLRLPSADEKSERLMIVIERDNEICKVGFEVDADRRCPIVSFKDTEKNVGAILQTIEQIVRQRTVPKPVAQS